METTAAILLRRTKLTETSLIVTWFTEAHGKLKTVAKGARQPKSRFAGALDLFYEAEISFARSTKSDLHVLRESVLRQPHEGIRQEYRRVQLASYFVELLELTIEPEHPAPEIFHLLQRALGYVSSHAPDRRALLHFESELARFLGIGGEGVASEALIRAYHRLPVTRNELLRSFRETAN